MRVSRSACIWLAALVVMFVPSLISACERIPAGETMWVRLTAPVSTYDVKVGDLVQGVVTESLVCGNETVVPVGARVLGTVENVHKVGWGVRYETAALKIAFNEIALNAGTALQIRASITEIDNARETISNGVVHGIRSTNTPQGTLTTRLKYLPGLNPYPNLALLVFKATFPIFPEPEIYFPTGTDIEIKLEAPIVNPPSTVAADQDTSLDAMSPSELRALAGVIPEHSTTANMVTADVVNLAFIGSREQFESAFSHAGWRTADPVNRHSILLNFYAVLKNGSYYQAPMRPFLLEGQVPDMNWQKSLNTYAQRDHMRVWEWPGTEITGPIFLGTATHDRSAGFSLKHHQFVHHIDANIDAERGKVIRDLRAAGCVRAVYLVPRGDIAPSALNGTGDPLRTDGSIAVVQLQDCHAAVPELESDAAPAPYRPGSAFFRYMRRDMLTLRSDMWRANIIYASYGVLRMGFHAWKHHAAVVAANPGAATATHAMVQAFDPEDSVTP